MDRRPRRPPVGRYTAALGAALVVQAVGGAAYKLLGGRPDDLPHAALHLFSGLLLLWVAAPGRRASTTRAGAMTFGGGYLALAVTGPLAADGLGALQLQTADHLFHLLAGGGTIAVAMSRAPRAPRAPVARAPVGDAASPTRSPS